MIARVLHSFLLNLLLSVLACAGCNASGSQPDQPSPDARVSDGTGGTSGTASTAGAGADGVTSCASDPGCAPTLGCIPAPTDQPARAPGEPLPQPLPQELPTCWDGSSTIECVPACAPAQQCVLQIASCDDDGCLLFPNCIDAPIDPCATVMCPGICAVDSEGRCVAVPDADPLAVGTAATAGSAPASLAHVFADAATLDCPSLAERYYTTLDARFDGSRSCASDDDCVLVNTDAACPAPVGDSNQLHFSGCGAAIARSVELDFEAARRDLEEQLCAIEALPSCNASSLCGPDLAARCVDGTCQLR